MNYARLLEELGGTELTHDEKCVFCNRGTIQESVDIALIPAVIRSQRHSRFPVWRCKQCSSLHSVGKPDLDYWYGLYPLRAHKMNLHAKLGYQNRLKQLTKAGMKRSDRILDFGCGTGLFVGFLKHHGFHNAHGYDPYLKEYADPEILNASYDFVTSYDVIEHFERPGDFMGRLSSCLSSHGKCVIGTPSAEHIELSNLADYSMELHQPYHRHIASSWAFIELFERYNLKVESLTFRSYFDTLVPTVNAKFLWNYCYAGGGIDTAFEPPRWSLMLKSPRLLGFLYFGYLFRYRGNMRMVFRYQQR